MSGFSTLDGYQIIRTLGTGCSGKVKLAVDPQTSQRVALKILTGSPARLAHGLKALQNELELTRDLDCAQLIGMREVRPSGCYTRKNGEQLTRSFAVLEFAPNGEFYEFLSKTRGLEENTVRFYFLEILAAVEALHAKDIAHRDLKPENLLLDVDMRPKLADFGFATRIKREGLHTTRLGSEPYMAPEIQYGLPYDPRKADVFSLGVILFIMLVGHLPFLEATENDSYYKLFVKKPKAFWQYHLELKAKRELSAEAVDLLTRMLCLNPHSRISSDKLRRSLWASRPVDEQRALQDARSLRASAN